MSRLLLFKMSAGKAVYLPTSMFNELYVTSGLHTQLQIVNSCKGVMFSILELRVDFARSMSSQKKGGYFI